MDAPAPLIDMSSNVLNVHSTSLLNLDDARSESQSSGMPEVGDVSASNVKAFLAAQLSDDDDDAFNLIPKEGTLSVSNLLDMDVSSTPAFHENPMAAFDG